MIREMSESNLSIVDVGHGNCAVLFGNNETVIVDCGGRGASLLRFLDSRGITKIKAIFLSHYSMSWTRKTEGAS
jgi:glyoxylase-like metal-dependent hydrolase (beta-lactamase superfamily II)